MIVACSTPKNIIFDTDIGSSTDDLFALHRLYKYQDEGKCNILGIVVDRMGDSCAMLADLMNTHYNHPNIPIALERNGIQNSKEYIHYKNIIADTLSNGSFLFSRTIPDYNVLPDGHQLYRQLLSQAADHSVNIVATGFITSIVQLLQSKPDNFSPLNGVELVHRKVCTLYFMGTKLGESDSLGYNLKYDTLIAQLFFQLWPTDIEIRISPSIVGDAIHYDSTLVVGDFSHLFPNPISQTYLINSIDEGQRMWDVLSVINAVEGDHRFRLSRHGIVCIDNNGKVHFSQNNSGNCRYHLPGSRRWNKRILQKIKP